MGFTIESAIPENPILEPNIMLISKPVAKLWSFCISNSLTSPKLTRTLKLGEVGIMEFGLKGNVTDLSRTCRGCHGEVGIVEFGLYIPGEYTVTDHPSE